MSKGEKCFQKKVLCIKVAHRFFTPTAVSDIIILVRSKRPPTGYSFIGEINNHTICVKFSPVTQNANRPLAPMPTSMSTNNMIPFISSPPPIPPRPMSVNQNLSDRLSTTNLDNGYVVVDNERQMNAHSDYSNNTMRSYQSQNSHQPYNPLQGVPFEINPIYDSMRSKEDQLVRVLYFFFLQSSLIFNFFFIKDLNILNRCSGPQ